MADIKDESDFGIDDELDEALQDEGPVGEVCWGDDNPIESNVRDFLGNITSGAGYRVLGAGDLERVELEAGGWIELETWNFGTMLCKISRDKYETGSGSVVIKYKNGSSEAICDADGWTEYSVEFDCDNWVNVRVEAA